MSNELSEAIKIIKSKNIFFGHRSVGDNILQGIKEIDSQYPFPKLNILKMENGKQSSGNYFFESYIGGNGDPKSKINDFCLKVNQLEKNNLSIAMMKLCYADIKSNTNINDVFNNYTEAVDSLQNKYPDLLIVHFTVPLTSKRDFLMSIKDFIKGRSDNGMLDNIERNKFNQLLYLKYSVNRIFDLAKLESTYSDGTSEEFIYQDKVYNSLITDYTDDGGHLNKEGKRLIAEKLILYLSTLSR